MKCPDCGSDVKYYHDTERTRIVCKQKCSGWKVIKTIDRQPTPVAADSPGCWLCGEELEDPFEFCPACNEDQSANR